MRAGLTLAAVLSLTLLGLGCASWRSRCGMDPQLFAELQRKEEARTRAWPLPPLRQAPFKGTLSKKLVLEKDGKSTELMALVERTQDGLAMAALDPLGRRLFKATWTAEGLTATAEVPLPPGMDPAQPLRELVFATWPLAALRDAMRGTAYELGTGEEGKRMLKKDGRLLLVVEEDGAGQRLWHPQEGYSILVSPLENGP